MDVLFHDDAFEDYQYFKQRDVRSFEMINKLIKDIVRSPFGSLRICVELTFLPHLDWLNYSKKYTRKNPEILAL